MSMKQLSLLVAQMFGWIPKMIRYPELDFDHAEAWFTDAKTTDELVKILDDNLADAKETLSKTDEAGMNEIWTMRKGDTILWEAPKHITIRSTISHMSHHRGQLSVYMRLNEIPVPSIYGPTADDKSFDL